MAEFILVVFVLILAMGAYWVFVLMPRQREFTQRQQMARQLIAGDEIITGGGLVATIQRIESDEGVAYIDLAKGVQVRILTAAILDIYDPNEIAKNTNIQQQTEDDTE
jgi:preprotein translocase YajC subunit